MVVAAMLLSVERIAYAAAWRRPRSFGRICNRADLDPVDALSRLFLAFKALQAGVFLGWCLWWPETTAFSARPLPVSAGLALGVAGQVLNVSVFRRLGRTGVFYGTRFGHDVPWVTGFPFSIAEHPQYLDTVMTIWGFFLMMRYPASDWMVLPLLETIYYATGARLESVD